MFYYVSGLDRAISFYSDVLGFNLISRDVVARFDVDGVLFELVPRHVGMKLGRGGNARLCLKVDDLNQAVEDLRRKMVKVEEIRKVEKGRVASFDDPDGNEICLWQYD